MKVQCGQCPAQYAVADERIRDKKVRIRCKRCNASIVVDGKVTPALVTSTPAARSARPASSMPAPESAPPSSPEPDSRPSPRPVAHTIMGGLEAPVARQLVTEHVAQRRSSAPPPPSPASSAVRHADTGNQQARPGMPEPDRGFTEPPARGESDRWRVALTQQDLRWMTTEEITQAFRDGAIKSETFVFRAGMPSWVTLLEVTEISEALAVANLVSPPLRAPRAPSSEDEGDSRPSSAGPRRLSSLPPPRKATRNRGFAGAASGDGAAGESRLEAEESLPFALVSGRSNGAKKPDAAPTLDAASSEPIAALDASLRELAAREGAARQQDTPREAPIREDAAEASPAVPMATAPQESRAAPEVPAAMRLPAPAPAAQALPDAGPVPSKNGAGPWLWLLLVLALVAAVVLYFRFFLGLP